MPLANIDFSIPFKNPVIIFSLVLFIILFAPIFLNKLKIPHFIGLIIAGIAIGPYGLNLLRRDSSIVLFGTVGLLYIMFTAGLEIDLQEFKKNRSKSFLFGIITFLFPMILGGFTAYYIFDFSLLSSVLFASMLGAHTLLAYPIASSYGVSRTKAVTLTIGGTIIADILALLMLAAVTGMSRGDIGVAFWLQLVVSSLICGAIIFFIFPIIARWFFKKFDDNISQYIFVLAMVFLGSFLAEVAGLEPIIGAFLSGVTLNRFIPHSSALMHRIEFVGNAFFIPFFLIGVGMLVDFTVLFKGWEALTVAFVMIVAAILGKYLAALFTQKTFRLTGEEGEMIFGLSTARVGATLAVVLVGYNIIIGETSSGEPIRLLNEDVLNGTILMILVTCTVSSFVVERAARKLALKEEKVTNEKILSGKILLSLAYPETATDLIDFTLMLKPKKSAMPVYALNVISDESHNAQAPLKKMMDKAIAHAASVGQTIIPIIRFDTTISNGIIYTLKEHNITDLIIGLHHGANSRNFLGVIAERILKHTAETVFIYKSVQPFNTLNQIVVSITVKAELEPGFSHWLGKLYTIAREAGLGIEFYAAPNTIKEIQEQQRIQDLQLKMNFHKFTNWEDFLIFTGVIKKDDLFVIVSSRKGHTSYQTALEKLPHYLSNYFTENSFIILYPQQLEHGIKMDDVQYTDSTLAETISEKVEVARKAGNYLKRLFK